MFELEGYYFNSEIQQDKISTIVRFQSSYISFQNTLLDRTRWTTARTTIEIGGASNHLIFFKNPDFPQQSFYIEKNKDSLLKLQSLEIESWKQIVNRRFFVVSGLGAVLGFSVVAIVALLFLAIYFRQNITSVVVSAIPISIEEKIGAAVLSSHVSYSEISAYKESNEILSKLLDQLKPQLPKDFQNIKAYVSKSKDLNAAALPGGYIFFHHGLIERAEHAHELLGVAAHELAHVTQRHVTKNILQGAGLFLVIQTMIGDVSGIIAVLADQGSFLLQQGFSRDMEEEADRIGFDYLVKSKIDPRGMSIFFQRILDEREKISPHLNTAEGYLDFLSSHPNTKERIEAVNKRYESLDANMKPILQINFPEFRKLKESVAEIKL